MSEQSERRERIAEPCAFRYVAAYLNKEASSSGSCSTCGASWKAREQRPSECVMRSRLSESGAVPESDADAEFYSYPDMDGITTRNVISPPLSERAALSQSPTAPGLASPSAPTQGGVNVSEIARELFEKLIWDGVDCGELYEPKAIPIIETALRRALGQEEAGRG